MFTSPAVSPDGATIYHLRRILGPQDLCSGLGSVTFLHPRGVAFEKAAPRGNFTFAWQLLAAGPSSAHIPADQS